MQLEDYFNFLAPDDIRIKGQTFGGVLDIRNKRGLLQVVETLDLEDYLRGVVPLELNSKWHPEVLKVQAIVARTYALYQKRQNNAALHEWT